MTPHERSDVTVGVLVIVAVFSVGMMLPLLQLQRSGVPNGLSAWFRQ